jgi:hypothetical protein
VKTDMMQKIPIVIPSNDRNVLNLLTTNDVYANIKLSAMRRRINIAMNYDILKLGIILKVKGI